ncbi:MAG: thrombospondin type 3 repeat-containing protein, partial [Pseudomonadota bacterium]
MKKIIFVFAIAALVVCAYHGIASAKVYQPGEEVSILESKTYQVWLIGDADGDTVKNGLDNCPYDVNLVQEDGDSDNRGDVCDNCIDDPNTDQKDTDGDGVGDVCDNCVDDSNPGQEDEDNNGVGDVCEAQPAADPDPIVDSDGDGVSDELDECPDEVGTEDNFGCPGAVETVDETALDITTSGLGADGGGACSMLPGAAANPLGFLLIAASLIPLAIRR